MHATGSPRTVIRETCHNVEYVQIFLFIFAGVENCKMEVLKSGLIIILAFIGTTRARIELTTTNDSVVILGNNSEHLGVLKYFNIFNVAPLFNLPVTIQQLQPDCFGVLQVHSHLYNISLVDTSRNNTLTGHNLGLNIFKPGNFTVRNNLLLVAIEVAIIFLQYNLITSPIPGDCSNDKRPMLNLIERNSVISVSTPDARLPNGSCNSDPTLYEHRFLFKEIGDTSAAFYFLGILDMVTAAAARRNGRENTISFLYNQTDYAKVKTSLLVVQTIALSPTGYVAYVPVTTYSCNPILWGSDCHQINPSQFTYYVVLLGVGLFIALRFLLPPLLLNAVLGAEVGVVSAILVNLGLNITDHASIIFYTVAALFGMIVFMMTTVRLPYFRRWVVCFVVSYLVILSIFYVSNASYNLMAFQYLFIGIFTTIFGLLLVFTPARESMICIVLGSILIYFSLSYLTDGQLYGVIEHPIFLLEDNQHKYAVKQLTFTCPDVVCVFVAIFFGMVVARIYESYGEVSSRMMEQERLWMLQHLYLCSREERMRLANENTPLITRFTESGEDEVFESPNTSKVCFQIKRAQSIRRYYF